jgi:hypothetical protein
MAQPGGGGGGGRGGFGGGRGGGGVGGLVAMEAVQKELGITDEQKTEITKVLEESRPMRGAGGGFNREEFQNLSEEDRAKRMEEFRKTAEETAKKVEEKVKGVLNEQQNARLSELRIQREGVAALNRAEVAEKLTLTAEQKEKIAKLNESLRPQFGRGGPGGGGGGERPNFEEMRAQREKTEGEIVAVLTEEQKASYEKMKGAKFEFPRPMGFGGGQGGGRTRPSGDNN